MRMKVVALRGITDNLVEAFKGQGVEHSDHLLERARTPKARQELAAALGVGHAQVLELANRADLARIKGIGKAFSDLLENAGVDTVKELAHRVPENLHAKLVQVNTELHIAGRMPRLDEVQDWIRQAKELPKLLEY